MVTRRSAVAGSKSRVFRTASSMAESEDVTTGRSASATGVGFMPYRSRTNSGSPMAPRRRFNAFDSAGCVIPSRSAARVTLRSSMRVTNTGRRLRS